MALDREKTLQAAQKLVDKQRFDKAIVEYRKVVEDDPGDVRTLLKVGDLHLKLEQYEPAVVTYEQVGEYYFREGFAVKAIAVFKQIRGIIRRHAQHLDAKFAHILPRLAEIYTQLGLTSDALAAYDEVATRLRQEGRVRDALDVFKRVLSLDSQNPIAHLRVADSRARLGDVDKAIDSFGEAAKIMMGLGRLDDAIKVYERLLEYKQEPSFARLAGMAYLERGQAHDGMSALSKLQIAFKANPKDLETLKVLAQAFDTINQPKKAIEVLKESARIARDNNDDAELGVLVKTLSERAPDDPQVRSLTAQWRARTGESLHPVAPAAPDSFDDSVELESLDEPIPTAALGGQQAAAPEAPGAQGALSADAAYTLETANAYRSAGHLAYAIQLLQAALTRENSFDVRLLLSDFLHESGDLHAAIAQKLLLARAVYEHGDGMRAVAMLDEVLLLHPGHGVASQLREQLYAQVYYGRYGYGAAAAEQPLGSYDVEFGGVDAALGMGAGAAGGASSVPPPSRAVLAEQVLDRVDALCDAGRIAEARALLTQELQGAPNHPLLLERLGELDVPSSGYPAVEDPAPPPSVSHYIDTASYGYGSYGRGAQPGNAAQPAVHHSPSAGFAQPERAVAAADWQTHYDLGVAYAEMGMHTEAIAELTLAAKDPARECVCVSIVATIYLQLGEIDAGIAALHTALAAAHITREQELALGYELGHTYEARGNAEQAVHFFEWLALLDPNYDDPRGTLYERIHRLRGTGSGPQPIPGAPPAPLAVKR